MKGQSGTRRGDQRHLAVHMTQEDKEDLRRFRALAEKMGPKEKAAVIHRMLEKPDTP